MTATSSTVATEVVLGHRSAVHRRRAGRPGRIPGRLQRPDYGDDVDEGGSTLAAVHRGWLSLKDALTGDKPSGVLDAAVQGEDHTVSEYEKALKGDLSEGFRKVLERQHGEIVAARDEVKALQTAS